MLPPTRCGSAHRPFAVSVSAGCEITRGLSHTERLQNVSVFNTPGLDLVSS